MVEATVLRTFSLALSAICVVCHFFFRIPCFYRVLFDSQQTGEQMKLEYQKKVASLNRQKKHGASTEAIEKTKATLSHLHTRYIVYMQSMDSTVSEINRLRDEQLYPKLVALVDG